MQIAPTVRLVLTATTMGIVVFSAFAASTASEADKVFVGKVSQGGLYEVEAGQVAAARGGTPVVRDFGAMEAHDHAGVNARLKEIAEETGVPIQPGLNAEFSARLAKLKTVPAAQFDAYYIEDMKQIHTKDEGLFVQETGDGSEAYKPFAHQTAVLVKAHLGWLGTE